MEQLRMDGGADPYRSAPAPASTQARALIVELHDAGLGWKEVARNLNARGVPTPSGRGQWWPQTVYRHTANRDGWAAYMRAYRAGHARR